MKTMIVFCALILAVPASFAHGGIDDAAAFFHVSLRPHGEWIRDSYGTAVWKPACVPAGWQPYTVGRWIWTADGWYWESDEPWGWATYHYGRWDYDPFAGWVWIPGREWAPSWVEWRYGGGYVGWIPLRPVRRVHLYVGFQYDDHWSYVRSHDIMKHRIDHHLLSKDRKKEARALLLAKLDRRDERIRDRRGPDRRAIDRPAGRASHDQRVLRDHQRGALPRGAEMNIPEDRRDKVRENSHADRSGGSHRETGRRTRAE